MSDGPAWGDADARPTDPRDLARLTNGAAVERDALRNAVARQAGLLEAARVVLALAGVAAKGSGIPLGSTAVDLARAALDAATEKRT